MGRRDGRLEGDVRVLIVDGQDLFRAGLRLMLERQGIHVIGDARTVDGALWFTSRLSPEVVLVDLALGASPTELVHAIIERAPAAKVVLLAADLDASEVVDALAAGACGYLAKDESAERIVAGIVRAAATGQWLLSERTTRAMIARLRDLSANRATPAGIAALSPRELEVLALIVDGKDNLEIAEALCISMQTVKHHVSTILCKLQVQNRLQAAVQAVRAGVV
jgi:DNA-binding NarL/FixJ family response regulator